MAFEQAFGLTWNESYGMYIVDDELHMNLKTRNPTFKFEIGQFKKEGPTVEINLPYASVDFSHKFDFDSTPVRYFPIQRAQNDSQLTLGRTFLQEAYVTANYEHANFSVSQCRWEEPVGKQIVPISSARLTNTTRAPPSQISVSTTERPSLDRNQIIGLVGGIVGFLILLTIFAKLWLSYQRRRHIKTSSTTALISSPEEIQRSFSGNTISLQAPARRKPSSIRSGEGLYEADQVPVAEIYRSNLNGLGELHDTDMTELPGHTRVFELPHFCSELPLLRPAAGLGKSPRRRYGIYLPTSDVLSSGNVVRQFARLDSHYLRTSRPISPSSRDSASTLARLKSSYLDRSLPPTPICESPQTLSYFPSWERVPPSQHERLDVDPSSADLHEDPFQHRRGFF
ncbi:MAG: hypothetical protein Q9166_005993 [cf. Caloplaca sp. 2 TL-2023]